jgi:hypothetical protein
LEHFAIPATDLRQELPKSVRSDEFIADTLTTPKVVFRRNFDYWLFARCEKSSAECVTVKEQFEF